MARVKLGPKRPNSELRLMKKNDLLHSTSHQNLREMTTVAEKHQTAMVAPAAVNTDQTMVPPSSSNSSSCPSSSPSSSSDGDDDDKQNHDHDQFHHNTIKDRDQSPVNGSRKQSQVRRAANPDHRHTSEANHDHTRIGCHQPLVKHEPLIIHAEDPRIIHADPGNFMLLVQSLTGSCTTRALCKQLEDQKHRKRKRNDNARTAGTDEVHEIAVEDLTVNYGLQKQKVKIKQQEKKQKQQKKKKNHNHISMERPADEQQCSSHLAAHYPLQLSPHLPAHLTHESPSSSTDSHHKFAESASLETENLSSSPSLRLQDEGSMGSSPNMSISDDDTTGTPFSRSWNMLTDSINSSPLMLPSFHGDQHDGAWTTAPWKFESIIDSFPDTDANNRVCWPMDEDDIAVNDDSDLCLSDGTQLASATFEGFRMEDHHAEYIYESSFSIPPNIDLSPLYRSSMPEILDIDSLFACAAD